MGGVARAEFEMVGLGLPHTEGDGRGVCETEELGCGDRE